MTTGRINQVTIVRRPRTPPGGHWGHPERLVTEMSAPGVRRRPGPAGDPCGLLLSPSKFPRGERAHAPAAAADGCDPDSPRVEDRFGRRPRWGGPPSRLPPDATVVGIASGQPPTEPIRRRQRALEGSRRNAGHPTGPSPRFPEDLGAGHGRETTQRETPIARHRFRLPSSCTGDRQRVACMIRDKGAKHARGAGGLKAVQASLAPGCGAGKGRPAHPGAGELVGGGGLGLYDPRTHPLLPHRSNIVPSRMAPPPGARCHQNHSPATNLYGKNKKCARGRQTLGPNCPHAGETVV